MYAFKPNGKTLFLFHFLKAKNSSPIKGPLACWCKMGKRSCVTPSTVPYPSSKYSPADRKLQNLMLCTNELQQDYELII